MAKKSRKQRAQQRKHAQAATAERLDVSPPSGAVASVPPSEHVRHVSGMRLRAQPQPAQSPVLESLSIAPPAELAPPASATMPVVATTPIAHQPTEEHRGSPRVSLAVDIHLASHSHFFSGLSGDISEGGLFFSTYRPLPIGSEVELEFTLPGAGEALHVRGTVKWVREHSTHGPRGVGIAFEDLPEEDRTRIHAFCSVRPALYYDDLD